MIRKAFLRLAVVGVGIGLIVLFAFWLPRYLWRRDWAAAVEQAKLFYDEADCVVATSRSDFAGKGGDSRDYRAINYEGATFQVRAWPSCWAKMVELADSAHQPRRFDDRFRFGDGPREAEARPILFIGDLETASGQSRFVVIQLDQVCRVKDKLQLPFDVCLARLNHESWECCIPQYVDECEVDIATDKDANAEIELKSYKRNKGQIFPRFHVRLDEIVSVFEIQLEDHATGFHPFDSTKVTVVKIKAE